MKVNPEDLKFKTLNFRKPYQKVDYSYGKRTYEKDCARIDTVETTDSKIYTVTAKVEDYSLKKQKYDVSIRIKDNMIFDCKCDCWAGKRGTICEHIIATSMEIIEPHFGSTAAGKIAKEKQEEEKKKKAEEAEKLKEYRKKYDQGLKALNDYAMVAENNDKIFDIQAMYQSFNEQKKKNSTKVLNDLNIECSFDIENASIIKATFKIGQGRMYVLSNLSEFFDAYINKEELTYGKGLTFIPARENINENSKELFDFIVKYAEMVSYGNSTNAGYRGATLLSNKFIYIRGQRVEELLDILKRQGNLVTVVTGRYSGKTQYMFSDDDLNVFATLSKEKVDVNDFILPWYTREYYEYGEGYNDYIYDDEDCYDFEEDEDNDDSDEYYSDSDLLNDKYHRKLKNKLSEEYVLRINIKDYTLLNTPNKIYIFLNNKIYEKERKTDIYNLFTIFKKQSEMLIPEDRIEEFERNILSNTKYFKKDESVKTVSDAKIALVVGDLGTKILLDIDDDGNILLELKFCYGDYEFNILDDNVKEYVEENNIIRDVPKESEILKRIFTDGFEYVKGSKELVMKKLDDMYEFLSKKIEGYMADFEVLATDRFKNKEIIRTKISNVGVKIDNGLLELDFSKINIDIQEMKDILKSYNVKKKYYKLKSGDFLDLSYDSQDLALLDELASTLDIDYSKLEKGKAKVPVNRSIYLEQLMNANKEINVTKNDEFNKLIDSIENTEISDDIKLDKELDGKLRDYQKVGYKWLKTLEKYKFGGILADDMGLGKTLQVIAVLKSEMNNKKHKPSIVVCPSTLVLNWKAEVEKWCDSMKVLIVRGTAGEREVLLNNYLDYDLLITSYDLLKRDIDYYEDKEFKYIIADEAQYIKNSTTQNATSLKSLKGETRFALTGTPIENSVAELWSIFDFIMPGYLYNYNKFKKKFEEPILKYEDTNALARLKKLISPFILRRLKKDVLTELPEKNITIIKNEMEEEQEKIYLTYLAQTRQEVADELDESGSFEKSKFKILMLLTRLRQICCHPSLFIENYKGGSGKLTQCMDLVQDAIDSGHKILIFSSYKSVFEIMEKELEKMGVNYFKLVGDTSVNKRIEMVDEFNNNESIKVFLISLKAGGTGLNLTSADIVIHYDPWWNVSSENQATDRAYRIGQKNSVQVYKLITSNSIEEKINKMQERKEKLSKDVLSTEETFVSKLSKDEILDLFK